MTSQLSFRFSWARTLTLGLVITAIALLGPVCSGPTLRAGVCVRDITPISPNLAAAYTATFGELAVVNHTDPIFIAGFGDNRQATGYHDQLWARGIVLDGFGGRIAIVSLDLVGYLNG